MLAHHGAGALVHLPQHHVVAPEVGELLQHEPRLVRVQELPVEHPVAQHQAPVARQIDVHHLDVRVVAADVVLARQGLAILMISSELTEIMGMSDRILVMREGRIVAEFARGAATQEAIVAAMMSESDATPMALAG